MLRMIVLVAIGWIVGLSARVLMPGKGLTVSGPPRPSVSAER